MTLARDLEALADEFPGLRIVEKSGDALSQQIDRALRVLTFGGQRAYVTTYTTVLGRTIYVPERWATMSDLEKRLVLRHEAVHLRQFARYGNVLMALLYAFPLLPFGLAIGRASLEWEAYRETLRATAELCSVDVAGSRALEDHITLQFIGPAYGYMWPFEAQVRNAIRREVARLRTQDRAGSELPGR